MAAPTRRILILGGTAEARQLASLLTARGFNVTTSLAGRTRAPRKPDGGVRLGGFGGTEGLRDFLRSERIGLLADATHPFAARISAHGVAAALALGLPYLRLERPAWRAGAGDDWRAAADIAAAAAMIPADATALVTVGRKEIAPFLARQDIEVIARMIDPPEIAFPARARLLLARPPFSLEQELAWFGEFGVEVLVAKNSGGAATEAKLVAARERNVPVIMVERPEKPAAETVSGIEAMADRIAETLAGTD